MNNRFILGIDTSNYKTSIAVTDEQCGIVCDLRRFLKVKQGERGLRQSDALFQHVKNIPELMEALREQFDGTFEAVAFSAKPRSVEGSYMPVFLAGESYGRSIAKALDIPAFAFSHQEGHIEAIRAFTPFQKEKKFLACHFSGGTSELLEVTETETGYDIEIVGGSKDIAFGQVLDRAGVSLGMVFPAGEEMDRIAAGAGTTAKLLTPIKVQDAWLNLSGIDTQMKNLLGDGKGNEELIRELFEKLAVAMAKMIRQGAEKTQLNKVIMAGGVSSSRLIRDKLLTELGSSQIHISFDDKGLSQDNAVGTALLGGKQIWR